MKLLLGPEFDDFAESLRQGPPVSIRYNPLKCSAPAGAVVPWCEHGRYLEERPSFTMDPTFHAGAYYVQEASSMFLEQAVRQSTDVRKRITALDLCAAPGGKSSHLTGLLTSDSLVVSNDAIRGRISALVENLEKTGASNLIITNNDPSDFKRLNCQFDLVVIDAPCSGEGLFRKEPEATKHWSTRNVALCADRQKRILESIWDSVKPDGVIIYSTCTFNDVENTDNLLSFFDHHDVEFIQLTIDGDWGVAVKNKRSCVGYQFYPHKSKGEGFYISVMRKKGGDAKPLKRVKDTLENPGHSVVKECKDWIDNADAFRFFVHGGTIRMIPDPLINEFQTALESLHVIQAGVSVAIQGKNKLVPEHSLAISNNVRKDAFRRISTTKEQAIAFLRRDPFPVGDGQVGYGLVEFDDLGLGWVNVLDNRVNNLYPSGRRIRMTPRSN